MAARTATSATRPAPNKVCCDSEAPEQNCLVCHNGTTVAGKHRGGFSKIQHSSDHAQQRIPFARRRPGQSPGPPRRLRRLPRSARRQCQHRRRPQRLRRARRRHRRDGGRRRSSSRRSGNMNSVSAAMPTASRADRRPSPGSFVQTNTRLQFSTGNQSFHPVEAAGKNRPACPA